MWNNSVFTQTGRNKYVLVQGDQILKTKKNGTPLPMMSNLQ
jgi:hypothetical protein